MRAKRKTICLRITKDLTLEVRAPLRMRDADIRQFVENHEAWIEKHLARLTEVAGSKIPYAFADGEVLPFRGGELRLATGEGRAVQLQGDRLLLPTGCDRPVAVAEFLREQARRLVGDGIGQNALAMGVEHAGVKITSATTRWGSCSGKNSLCFTYRVACLPPELLEYIVVHELAHIREHNHSARFWAVVEARLPDCAARRARLREFQRRIPF